MNQNRSTKHEDMKSANILAVFNCLRTQGPLTKRQIQEHTGLSWGSVFNITSFLNNRKIIIGQKISQARVGRVPELIDLDAGCFILHPARGLHRRCLADHHPCVPKGN